MLLLEIERKRTGSLVNEVTCAMLLGLATSIFQTLNEPEFSDR